MYAWRLCWYMYIYIYTNIGACRVLDPSEFFFFLSYIRRLLERLSMLTSHPGSASDYNHFSISCSLENVIFGRWDTRSFILGTCEFVHGWKSLFCCRPCICCWCRHFFRGNFFNPATPSLSHNCGKSLHLFNCPCKLAELSPAASIQRILRKLWIFSKVSWVKWVFLISNVFCIWWLIIYKTSLHKLVN